MKPMKYLSILLLLGATSCEVQQPISKEPAANNQDYKVAYLFEHDGCKVYRFYDHGNCVYFTNCNGETIARADSSQPIRNSIKVQH